LVPSMTLLVTLLPMFALLVCNLAFGARLSARWVVFIPQGVWLHDMGTNVQPLCFCQVDCLRLRARWVVYVFRVVKGELGT
jgi:hypothetical protein